MHLERILTFLQGGDDHAASAWRDRPLTADFASLCSRPGEVSRDRRLCGWLPPVRTPVRRSIDPVPTTRLPRVHMNVKSTSTRGSAADGLRCRALVGAFSGIGGTQSQQPVATPTRPLRELDRCRIRCIGGIAVQVKGAYERQARRTLARRERGGAIRRVVAARREPTRTRPYVFRKPAMHSHSLLLRAIRLAPFVAAAAFCASPSRAADLWNPGEYQWTMKTNADAPRTTTTCVTPEMAMMANGDSRSGREAAMKANKGRCSIQEYDVSGNKVTYRITCGDRVMASTTTFHGDSSEGDLTTTVANGGAVSHTHTTAKRLGACK